MSTKHNISKRLICHKNKVFYKIQLVMLHVSCTIYYQNENDIYTSPTRSLYKNNNNHVSKKHGMSKKLICHKNNTYLVCQKTTYVHLTIIMCQKSMVCQKS